MSATRLFIFYSIMLIYCTVHITYMAFQGVSDILVPRDLLAARVYRKMPLCTGYQTTPRTVSPKLRIWPKMFHKDIVYCYSSVCNSLKVLIG